VKRRLLRLQQLVGSRFSGGFLRQSGIYGLGQIVEGLSAVLLLPVFVAFLTPDDFALVSLSEMVGSIISSCWGIRFGSALTRFYYEYKGDQQRRFVASLWWAFVMNACAGLVILILVGPFLLPYIAKQVSYSPYLELMTWTVFARLFAELPLALMRIRQEAHLAVISALGSFLLFVGAKLYFVVVAGDGGLGALKAGLWGSGCSAVGYCIYMVSQYPLTMHWQYVRESAKYSWPMTPEAMLSGATMVMDRFFLDKWVPLTSIGYYSVASQFGAIAYQSVVTLKMAFVPAVLRIWVQEQSERWKVGDMALLVVAATTGVSLAVSLFAQDVLIAVGRERFFGAVDFVPFLTVNAVLVALVTIASMSFVLSKRTIWITPVSILHAAITGIVNVLATPAYGVWGTIAASLSGWASRALSFWLLGKAICPLPVPWGRIVVVILPAVPLGLLGLAPYGFDWLTRLLWKSGLIGVYFGYVLVVLWWDRPGDGRIRHDASQ